MNNIERLIAQIKSDRKRKLNNYEIVDVQFSEGTYVIEVSDLKVFKTFSTFIQIGEDIKDSFCDCGIEEMCDHTAKALLTIYGNHYDPLTSWSCIIIGIVCFMKPINDVPWAAILGLFAGVASAVLVAMNLPDEVVAIADILKVKYIVLIISKRIFIGILWLKIWPYSKNSRTLTQRSDDIFYKINFLQS